MKIAMFTILSDDFYIGFRTFMKSFLYHNKWFDLDFVILDLGLSPNIKNACKKMYNKVIFRKPNYDKYKDVNFNATHPKLRNTYYFLDVFSLYEYDKILSIDVDMVVLDNLKDLFYKTSNGITGVKGYNRRKDRLGNQINSGLFIVGSEYLNKQTYNTLVQLAQVGYSMPEQKTMNLYFYNKYDYVNKRYNVEKRMLGTKRYKHIINNPAIIHYVGLKPWQEHNRISKNEKGYEELEKIWWEWYYKK
jgi:lipopolysaccharide biosynthesis glycosyltransferase